MADTVDAAALERAWQERVKARAEFEADPRSLEDQDVAEAYWARIDAAEEVITADRSGAPRAAEMQVWVAWAWAYPTTAKGIAAMVQQSDFAGLSAVGDQLDQHEKALLGAIANLRMRRL